MVGGPSTGQNDKQFGRGLSRSGAAAAAAAGYRRPPYDARVASRRGYGGKDEGKSGKTNLHNHATRR